MVAGLRRTEVTSFCRSALVVIVVVVGDVVAVAVESLRERELRERAMKKVFSSSCKLIYASHLPLLAVLFI